MGKALLYRLLGLGSVPRRLRPLLEREGILLLDEGMRGSLRMRSVDGPYKRYRHRVEYFAGCLVVTKARLVCYTFWKRQIHIAVDDPRIANLYADRPEGEVLSLAFESSAFREGWRGGIEFRFHTEKASRFAEVLWAHGVPRGAPPEGPSPPPGADQAPS